MEETVRVDGIEAGACAFVKRVVLEDREPIAAAVDAVAALAHA